MKEQKEEPVRWHDIRFVDRDGQTELVFDAGTDQWPVPVRPDDVELLRTRVNARPPAGPALACMPPVPAGDPASPGAQAPADGKPADVRAAAEHVNQLLARSFEAEAAAAVRKAHEWGSGKDTTETEKDTLAGHLIEEGLIFELCDATSGRAQDDRLRVLLDVLLDLVPWTEVGAYWRQRAAPGPADTGKEGGEEPR